MVVIFQKGKIIEKVLRNSYKNVCGLLVMCLIMRSLESSICSICLSEDSDVIWIESTNRCMKIRFLVFDGLKQ